MNAIPMTVVLLTAATVALKFLIALLFFAAAMLASGLASGATPNGEPPSAQAAQRETIPGAELLTAAERDAYRRRMAQAATREEREGLRAEYANLADQRAPARAPIGDPKRGARLHGMCFSCHGIERYVAPVTSATASFFDSVLRASGLSDQPVPEPTRFKGRIRSLDALREAVNRRNDYFNPKMTPQEVEDVVAYLNVTYYKFPYASRAAR